jgi:hypothetical protein
MRALAAAPRTNAEAVGVVAAETASTMDGRELFGPSATQLDGNSGGAPEYVSKDSYRAVRILGVKRVNPGF